MERPARAVAALPASLAPSGAVELSPFDLANQGRAIPMVWFYRETLDRMIQEELFIQAADDMQVSVTNAEVDRAIRNVQTQAGLDVGARADLPFPGLAHTAA